MFRWISDVPPMIVPVVEATTVLAMRPPSGEWRSRCVRAVRPGQASGRLAQALERLRHVQLRDRSLGVRHTALHVGVHHSQREQAPDLQLDFELRQCAPRRRR